MNHVLLILLPMLIKPSANVILDIKKIKITDVTGCVLNMKKKEMINVNVLKIMQEIVMEIVNQLINVHKTQFGIEESYNVNVLYLENI